MKFIYASIVVFAHISIYLIYKLSGINKKIEGWGDLFYDRLNEIQNFIKTLETDQISKKDIKNEIVSRKQSDQSVIELPASSRAEKLAKVSAKISEGARRAWANRTPEMKAAMLAKRAETRAKRAASQQPQPQDQGNQSQVIG